ncbi:MAG: HAD family hydrolase [Halorientalis sp.]
MVATDYDTWVLDLDGTLVDVEESYVHDVLGAVGDRIGHEFSEREAETLWHGLGGSRNAQLREWGVDVDAFWAAFHDVEDARTRAEHTFLYDDASVVADVDAPVALVTHCQQYLTDPVLDHLDIRDWFDAVVCCTPETGWKPDPAPVETALDDASASGAGVLVGDSPHDIGAAWNAGLDGVHVERHSHERRGHCVRGDYRVRSLEALRPGATTGSD